MPKSIFDKKDNLLFYKSMFDEHNIYMLYILDNSKKKITERIENNIINTIRIGRAKKYIIEKDNQIRLIKDGIIYLHTQDIKIYEPTKEQLEKYKILYYQYSKEKKKKEREETLRKLRKKYEPTIDYIKKAIQILDSHIKDSNKTLTHLIKRLIEIREDYYVGNIERDILEYAKDYKHFDCIKNITSFLTDYIVSRISADVEHDVISISTPEYEKVYIAIERFKKELYHIYIDKSLCKTSVNEPSKFGFVIDKATSKNLITQIHKELKEIFN